MNADPLRVQIERDIEDCISHIQALEAGGGLASDSGSELVRLRQRLTDLCTALGRMDR